MSLGILCGSAAQPTGGVVAWGNGAFGPPSVPAAVRSHVIAIAAGTAHLLALRPDGTVMEWGIHELEAGAVADIRTAVAIAAGRAHSAALLADGTVAVWGHDVFGQLRTPEGLRGVIAIAAAGDHTVALRADGDVVVWGDSQVVLTVPHGATQLTAIATGEFGVQALRSDGSLLAWHLAGLPRRTIPEAQNAASFGSGRSHQAAVSPDGRLYVWWETSFGIQQVDQVNPAIPLAARADRLLAVRRDGTVVSMGEPEGQQGGWGELPVPSGLSRVLAVASGDTYSMALVAEAAPVILQEPGELTLPEFSRARFTVGVEDAAAQIQWRHNGRPLPGSTGTTLEIPVAWVGVHDGLYDAQVRIGTREVTSRSARLVLTPALPGNLVAWGSGSSEDLLPSGARSHVRAVALGGFGGVVLHHGGRVSSWPEAAPDGLGPVEAVAAGFEHRVAVERGGRVVVWGGVEWGQDRVPGDLTDVVVVSAGGLHTLALTREGRVVAWGDNSAGQCAVPAGLDHVVAMTAGHRHSAALRDDGSLVQWGGHGFPASQTPANLERVQAVAAGSFHTLALLRNGSVRAWGANGRRQVDVPAELGHIVGIAAGSDVSMALNADGRLICWGAGWIQRSPPGLWGISHMAAGGDFAVALIGAPRLGVRQSGGRIWLEWFSRGETLLLQHRDAWAAGPWQDVAVPGVGADGRWSVPLELDSRVGAYRLVRPVREAPPSSP